MPSSSPNIRWFLILSFHHFWGGRCARGEFEEALLEVEQEEDTETIHDDLQEGEGDALLATVLCSAYPGNVAMRSFREEKF